MQQGRKTGENHHRAKLSNRDVDLIHELRASGMRLADIAEKMECSIRHVRNILNGNRR